MSTKSQQVYRPVEPSDLPKIQAGILKAFYKDDLSFPAQLLTTHYSSLHETVFLAKGQDYDFLLRIHEVVVDVTPEKRYAVWSHTKQKFVSGLAHQTRTEAEIEISEMVKKYAVTDEYKKRFYVVEWEIKKDD